MMPVWILPLLNFLRANWRVLAIIAIAGAVYLWGRHDGAGTVRAQWQAERLEILENSAKEKQAIIDRGNALSATYQAELAARQKKINQLDRKVKDEIAKHYGTCIAGADIVQLWQQNFSPSASDPATR